jgi:hypothetical protein
MSYQVICKYYNLHNGSSNNIKWVPYGRKKELHPNKIFSYKLNRVHKKCHKCNTDKDIENFENGEYTIYNTKSIIYFNYKKVYCKDCLLAEKIISDNNKKL